MLQRAGQVYYKEYFVKVGAEDYKESYVIYNIIERDEEGPGGLKVNEEKTGYIFAEEDRKAVFNEDGTTSILNKEGQKVSELYDGEAEVISQLNKL